MIYNWINLIPKIVYKRTILYKDGNSLPTTHKLSRRKWFKLCTFCPMNPQIGIIYGNYLVCSEYVSNYPIFWFIQPLVSSYLEDVKVVIIFLIINLDAFIYNKNIRMSHLEVLSFFTQAPADTKFTYTSRKGWIIYFFENISSIFTTNISSFVKEFLVTFLILYILTRHVCNKLDFNILYSMHENYN